MKATRRLPEGPCLWQTNSSGLPIFINNVKVERSRDGRPGQACMGSADPCPGHPPPRPNVRSNSSTNSHFTRILSHFPSQTVALNNPGVSSGSLMLMQFVGFHNHSRDIKGGKSTRAVKPLPSSMKGTGCLQPRHCVLPSPREARKESSNLLDFTITFIGIERDSSALLSRCLVNSHSNVPAHHLLVYHANNIALERSCEPSFQEVFIVCTIL
eukprot:1160947-Pelagomonas_calceolata.AAC.3